MIGRCMYVWKLAPVIAAEGSVSRIVDKAQRAQLAALWIKIAEGQSAYRNVEGATGKKMSELVHRCHDKDIQVWGWHVPRCASTNVASKEARTVKKIASDFELDGIIMDAEDGPKYFIGGKAEAEAYAKAMRSTTVAIGKPLAISSHDIPQNFADWLPKFNKIASVADYNFPQVYYGSSPSVLNRLTRAENANSHVTIPFVPVGAGWIGGAGGCSSASACAERAREFIRLVHERGYEGHSFWHWAGAPMALWEVLNSTPSAPTSAVA